jgi:hypothetical protein
VLLDVGGLLTVWSVAVGDVTGDGRADVVAGAGGNLPNAAVVIFAQQADGSLGAMSRLPSFDLPNVIRLADLNSDGRLDLVVGHREFGRLGVYLQSPAGLGNEQFYTANTNEFGTLQLALGDINHDGRVDIVYGANLLFQLAPVQAASARNKTGVLAGRAHSVGGATAGQGSRAVLRAPASVAARRVFQQALRPAMPSATLGVRPKN